MTLIYRVRRAEDLVLRGELDAIAEARGTGPPGMTAAAERSLRCAGVPRRCVHSEALET